MAGGSSSRSRTGSKRPDHRRGACVAPTVVALDDDGRVVQRFSLYEGGKLGSGANIAFRTAVMRSIGGFDMRLGVGTPGRSGEDLESPGAPGVARDAIGFEPAAFVLHSDRDDDAALQHKLSTTGAASRRCSLRSSPRTHDTSARCSARFRSAPGGCPVTSCAGSGALGGPAERQAEEVASVSRLARLEMRGMIAGPGAFLRSARQARRDYS